MPTGYTDGVARGKVTSFQEYALLCARAFGACVTLRDEQLSSDIPEFEPNPYYAKKIENLKKEIAKLQSMTQEEREVAFKDCVFSVIKTNEELMADKLETKKRYEKMLIEAEKFVPPSKNHIEYKKFIIQQLKDSIEWDCDISFYESQINKMKNCSPQEWFVETISQAQKDLSYCEKELKEECSRVESRNNWVAQLKGALNAV